MTHGTLLLGRAEVRDLLDEDALLRSLRSAFASYSLERSVSGQRAHTSLPGSPSRSVMVVFPGLAEGVPAYTVKVNAKIPGAATSVLGLILLNDLATGRPLALMDSIEITATRTALAGAVAADTLARHDARAAAIVGAGVQGEAQLRALCRVRRIERATVFDVVPGRAAAFAERVAPALGLEIVPSMSVGDAVANADVIITATWAREPFLTPGMVRAGTHITAVGADEPGKGEVDAALLARSRFVCDDRDLAVRMGALASTGLGPDAVHAELGEVIAKRKPGRTSDDDITVFGSVGLPFQDVVAAWQVYQAARDRGIGARFDFHAPPA